MKKILLFALPLLAMLAVSCEKDNGELSGNDIIEFKDPNFLKALLVVQEGTTASFDDVPFNYKQDIDINKDGKISVKEASKVKMLLLWDVVNEDYYPFHIKEMSEIKYFTSLTRLECFCHEISELDLSKNTALEYLHCGENDITTLDVSKCIALKGLSCRSNELTELDLSKNTALTSLYCSYNQLTELDLSKNTALEDLDCSYNQLTELDLSKNTALTYLYCDNNQLTELDLSKNTALTYLYCDNNPLEKIYLNVKNNLSQDTINQYKDIIEYVK